MNILIVDDNPANLKLLRAQLEAEQHTVEQAHDGVEALEEMKHREVDAVSSRTSSCRGWTATGCAARFGGVNASGA